MAADIYICRLFLWKKDIDKKPIGEYTFEMSPGLPWGIIVLRRENVATFLPGVLIGVSVVFTVLIAVGFLWRSPQKGITSAEVRGFERAMCLISIPGLIGLIWLLHP